MDEIQPIATYRHYVLNSLKKTSPVFFERSVRVNEADKKGKHCYIFVFEIMMLLQSEEMLAKK